MRRRNVLPDGELPPDGDTERFVEIPKGNDRMFAIELRNRGRVRRGTATVWRWVAILEAIKRRHADASILPKADPYQARARALAVEAGLDPDAKIDPPGQRPMPTWCTFRDSPRKEQGGGGTRALAPPLPPPAPPFQGSPLQRFRSPPECTHAP